MGTQTGNRKVLAVGELLWDQLPSGPVLGGAPSNLAVRLAALDISVTLVSRVGTDILGTQAIGELRAAGVSDEFIQLDSEAPTGEVTVALSATGNANYLIHPDAAFDSIEWTEALEKIARSAEVICYGTVSQRSEKARSTVLKLLSAAGQAEKFLDLNLRRECYSRETVLNALEFATILKLNQDEVFLVRSLLDIRAEGVRGVAQELIARFNLKLCIVTRSELGVLAIAQDGTSVDLPGVKAQVVDTIGSGDAFTAGFLSRYLRGESLKSCCSIGNRYASMVAGTKGGMSPVAVETLDQSAAPAATPPGTVSSRVIVSPVVASTALSGALASRPSVFAAK